MDQHSFPYSICILSHGLVLLDITTSLPANEYLRDQLRDLWHSLFLASLVSRREKVTDESPVQRRTGRVYGPVLKLASSQCIHSKQTIAHNVSVVRHGQGANRGRPSET